MMSPGKTFKFLLITALVLLFTPTAKPQEISSDEYNMLGKKLCCYTDTSGNPLVYTSDSYKVFISDKIEIDYSSPVNIFTYEVKEDTMFFMNSVKLNKFLEALVSTLTEYQHKNFYKMLDDITVNYNGHKIDLRYRTRKLDFQIKDIDNGTIAFLNWSGGFVLKTSGFKMFMHRIIE